MLVLTRKPRQGIIINTKSGPIRVYVSPKEDSSNETRVAIDAPDDVHIIREELARALEKAPGKKDEDG